MSAQWNDPSGGFHPVSAPDYLRAEQLRELQLGRLQSTVRRVYDNVELYRKRMDESGLRPDDIRSLDDAARLPFTVKNDLRDTYPYGLFASPMREIVRLHASSGTTGKPIVVGYTKEDVVVWANSMARTLAAGGVGPDDIIQNTTGYGLFTGGLGFHYGGEALGATVIPISGGFTERQIMVMRDFGVTVVCATPSYFLHILDTAREMKVDFHDLPLRTGMLGAEPWSEAMRQRIEAESGVKAHDVYGLSEIIGPGVASECSCQAGLHIYEDLFYPEIVDPRTGELLPPGEEGELILTTLSKKAMPILRYRTRDLAAFIPEPCPCGRTIRRVTRIVRRCDDMLIIRGINVYPSQIESALLTVEHTLPHYQIILTRPKDLDEMEVQVEIAPEAFSDTVGAMERLQDNITRAIERFVGIRVTVRLIEPHGIARSEGKAKRVIDKRAL